MGNAVLFTNNGPGLEGCGAIEHVLSSLDFGPGTGKLDVQSVTLKLSPASHYSQRMKLMDFGAR